MSNNNIYSLSRIWFDFCFENPEKIKPNHTALYFFCIEHCNRLGWKEKFGLPTTMAKEAIGIRSYNTYINTLNDIVDWGFIKLIEKSKNQYSSNIIALSNFDKALDKALDKAFIKHGSKQSESTDQSTCESTDQSICSINKQIYKYTNIQINNYKAVFDFYQTLNLIKHKNYTKTMSESIRLFIKNTKSTEEECMEALKKHSKVVENSKKEEYPIKARTFSEFFGQKVFGGKELIGEQYINGGKYFDYTPKKVITLPEHRYYVPNRERTQNG